MNADIINIGDELLIGQTVNTNAAWMGKELSQLGVSIVRSTTITDERLPIIAALKEALERSEIIIFTGGLGPTKDDITKETLADFFDMPLTLHEDVLARVKSYFESKGREMLETNIQQAYLPEGCMVLDNHLGTASGMWFDYQGKVIVSLPGVPYEMKALMSEEVLPRISAKYGAKGMYYQTLMTQGIGESFLAEKIKDWENRIYKDGLSLAYLPSPGVVKLRLTSKRGREDAEKISAYFKELENDLPKYVYGKNGETVMEVVGKLLKEKEYTLGSVESCSGGGIAQSYVQYDGASDFFMGSLITYSNHLKMKLAHVKPLTLENHGAVSEQVVLEMVKGGREVLGVDCCIAVSGVAGPSGGSEEKPVGTVWIAVATPNESIAKQFRFGTDRKRNIEMTVLSASNLLRQVLLEIPVL